METGKWINLGNRSESIGMAVPEEKKNEVYYPGLYLSDIDLGIEKADVGDTVEAKVKVKIKSKTTRTNSDGKTSSSVDLDVHEIKFNE